MALRQRERREALIRSENAFELIAREWHERQQAKWTGDHADTVLRRIERHLLPRLGAWPIAEIDAPILLDALRSIELKAQQSARGSNEIAHRMLQASSAIFRYAIVTGRARQYPAVHLRGALLAKERTRNLPALPEEELPGFLQKLQAYDGHALTKLAMRLLILTFDVSHRLDRLPRKRNE